MIYRNFVEKMLLVNSDRNGIICVSTMELLNQTLLQTSESVNGNGIGLELGYGARIKYILKNFALYCTKKKHWFAGYKNSS